MEFSTDKKSNFYFHELMSHRVHEILLVASPYDAFILEEDGRLTDQIITEYLGMNLSYAPRVWRAATAKIALELLSKRPYDLIILMLMAKNLAQNINQNTKWTNPQPTRAIMKES